MGVNSDLVSVGRVDRPEDSPAAAPEIVSMTLTINKNSRTPNKIMLVPENDPLTWAPASILVNAGLAVMAMLLIATPVLIMGVAEQAVGLAIAFAILSGLGLYRLHSPPVR